MWKPVLDGADAERARAIAIEIADDIARRPRGPRSDPFEFLLDGYLALETHSPRCVERAITALETAVIENVDPRARPSLYSGLAGVGFLENHLTPLLEPWLEPPDDDPWLDLDARLMRVLDHYPADGEFDHISGLAGIATYAAERMPRSAAASLLERIVDRLAAGAEEQGRGVAWRTRPERVPPYQRQGAPRGYYNLGVAHGAPGVAVALARIAAFGGTAAGRAKTLCLAALEWIASQQLPAGSGARFPPWTPIGGSAPAATREAWCYGGLGLSVSVLTAARLLGDARWEQQALDFATREAARPPEDSGVVDAALCHGAAGNAHLYNRLYQATGDEAFLAACRRWLARTMDFHAPGGGVGGYLFSTQQRGGIVWSEDTDFLTGAAGVGLALLAAAGRCEPSWDRLLAADVPGGPTSRPLD
jgi:lantibiotic biosynthesis protein